MITLAGWLKEEHERLERFAAFYAQGIKDRPDMFSNMLPPGEWDEQYRMWEE